MNTNIKTSEKVAREIQHRQMLLNSAKKKCAPLEKKVRTSMGEKYPLGMTPMDIANEIERHIEDGSYTDQMPNINLANANEIEGAIIEGKTDDLMNTLLIIANQSSNLDIAAQSLEMYNQIESYQRIEPARIKAEEQERLIRKMEEKEIAFEVGAAKKEQEDELNAAIQEDKEELRDSIREEEERKSAEKNEKESKKPIIESPKKVLKRAFGFDMDR